MWLALLPQNCFQEITHCQPPRTALVEFLVKRLNPQDLQGELLFHWCNDFDARSIDGIDANVDLIRLVTTLNRIGLETFRSCGGHPDTRTKGPSYFALSHKKEHGSVWYYIQPYGGSGDKYVEDFVLRPDSKISLQKAQADLKKFTAFIESKMEGGDSPTTPGDIRNSVRNEARNVPDGSSWDED